MDKESNHLDVVPSVGRRGSAKCLHRTYHVREHGLPSDTRWVKRKDTEPSLAPMSVSTASCSQWQISCGECPTRHGARRKNNQQEGKPYDWRKPNRHSARPPSGLPSIQTGWRVRQVNLCAETDHERDEGKYTLRPGGNK